MASLTVRQPHIDLATMELPPLWLGGDAFRTQLFNAMSMVFPLGEQYFIDSVRKALPLLDDPAQHETIRRFIGQEAIHSRVHQTLNQRLEATGLRNVMEPLIRWRIRSSEPLHVLSWLAISMAYEHFTATLGDVILKDQSWLDGCSEPMAVLWTWHALEEAEHRAVVFDIYRALGGGHGRRLAWYLYASLMFAIDISVLTLSNLYRSGHLVRPATWTKGLRFLFGRGGMVRRVLPAWFAYFRPGFSPHQGDDPETARHWLERHQAWFRE